jgi:glycosyltransferase involved in cell wall biosynthesis
MRISVVHPARNEHSEIEATVSSMLAAGADEVLVFDDGSDTPIPEDTRTVHFRHDVSLGPSVCRNLGARRSTGDVIVFADAHTRIDDLRGICGEAVRRQAIMVPAMQSLHGKGEVTGYSRNFICKGVGSELIAFDIWNRRPEQRYTRLGGNWGGFFIMPRTVYEKIGGWVDHHFWGYNDPSLILKAWFCDVPVILDRDTIYKHKGKVKCGFGYPVAAIHPLFNILHSYRVIFNEQTWEDHWKPLMDAHHHWMMERGLARVSTEAVLAEVADFATRKVRSDEEFFSDFLPSKGFNAQPCDD